MPTFPACSPLPERKDRTSGSLPAKAHGQRASLLKNRAYRDGTSWVVRSVPALPVPKPDHGQGCPCHVGLKLRFMIHPKLAEPGRLLVAPGLTASIAEGCLGFPDESPVPHPLRNLRYAPISSAPRESPPSVSDPPHPSGTLPRRLYPLRPSATPPERGTLANGSRL